MVNDLSKIKPTILFVASHNVENTSHDVDAAKAIVTFLYHQKEWGTFISKKTLRDAIDLFIESRNAWQRGK